MQRRDSEAGSAESRKPVPEMDTLPFEETAVYTKSGKAVNSDNVKCFTRKWRKTKESEIV